MLPPPGFSPATGVVSDAILTTASSVIDSLAATALSSFQIQHSVTSSTASIASIATAAATAFVASGSHKGPKDGDDGGECKLLGPFALFIQAALGALALLSLVFKRYRERPQRPVKIWAFDASKQVFGSVLVHIANLLMSMLSAGQLSMKVGGNISSAAAGDGEGYRPNPCSFYLLNLAIDTTLGIPILILLLRLLTRGFAYTSFGSPRESIQSGNYGQPPKAWWWFKQSIIYFMGLMGMKLCVLFIFSILPWISRVGDWALRWTEGDERIQVFFVMLFFPVVMNAMQYYIIDSFIKDQQPKEHQPLPSDDGRNSTEDLDDTARSTTSDADPSRLSSDSLLGSDQDLEERHPKSEPKITVSQDRDVSSILKSGEVKSISKNDKEYDPTTDGVENSIATSSGSGSSDHDTLIPGIDSKSGKEATP